ncbi:MAG: tRNA (adenine-N1)-methyltransferase [Clostridia bacterium]|nr:tRNA (adenine-N1)-methyltransferase [Deltaproteobacteria bacterium]
MVQTDQNDALFCDESFKVGEPVIIYDRKHRGFLVWPLPGKRLSGQAGAFESELLIGQQPGIRLVTMKGEYVTAYRPTLEEYVLLMPRAAQIIPPKDLGYMLTMADVFPGAYVVEAGIGSGALTLALLRAVGEKGSVTSFELRDDHANCAVKNIERWRERLEHLLKVKKGDVVEGLAAMRDVDRIFLDLPEPWVAMDNVAHALKAGGIVLCYLPTMRQVDQVVQKMLDMPVFSLPDVAEVILRPWMADRTRLRPVMRMVSHSGFLVRVRKRGPKLDEVVNPSLTTPRAPLVLPVPESPH